MKRFVASALAWALLTFVATTGVLAQAVQIPPGEVCFQANSGVTGSIGALAITTAGTGGSPATYTNVPLLGGNGTGATADITVSSSAIVSQAVIRSPGTNYQVGDTLIASATLLGGAQGLALQVSSITTFSSVAGGTVGFYVPGTLNIKQTWQDAGQTILNTNPVTLDANGCGIIYGTGIYRQIVKDSLGNTVWDRLTGASGAIWGGLSGGSANAQTIPQTVTLVDGQPVSFIAGFTNTGSLTVTPSGGSPIIVEKNTSAGPAALTGGEIIAGNVVNLIYSATGGNLLLDTYPVVLGGFVPQGAVMAFKLSACPTGWIASDGTNSTADLRGYFVRGLDTSGAIDPSRTLGSLQQDQLQSFIATYSAPVTTTTEGNGTGSAPKYVAGLGLFPAALSGANFGSETRPKNVSLLYCQKS